MAADWGGEFGDDYVDRNLYIKDRSEFFERFEPYGIKNALEVGCNIGSNMVALKKAFDVQVTGVDINAKALEIADAAGLYVLYDDATDLDFPSNEYNLVFTVGVLIHLNTPELIRAMQEMHRVSNGFVLFAEYYGDDIEVPYRGERGALIKRDYGGIYQALFPGAIQVETGTAGDDLGFDDVTYWMFYDVSNSASKDGFYQTARESIDGSQRGEPIGSLVGAVGSS